MQNAQYRVSQKKLPLSFLVYFIVLFISPVPFHLLKRFYMQNKGISILFILHTKTCLQVKRGQRYQAYIKVIQIPRGSLFWDTLYVFRTINHCPYWGNDFTGSILSEEMKSALYTFRKHEIAYWGEDFTVYLFLEKLIVPLLGQQVQKSQMFLDPYSNWLIEICII